MRSRSRQMLPTASLAMSPYMNVASMATLVVLIGLGALGTLIARLAFGRRPDPAEPVIEILRGDAVDPARRRVNG